MESMIIYMCIYIDMYIYTHMCIYNMYIYVYVIIYIYMYIYGEWVNHSLFGETIFDRVLGIDVWGLGSSDLKGRSIGVFNTFSFFLWILLHSSFLKSSFLHVHFKIHFTRLMITTFPALIYLLIFILGCGGIESLTYGCADCVPHKSRATPHIISA